MRHLLKPLVTRYRKRRNLRLGLRSRDPFVISRELVGSGANLIVDVGAHVGLAAKRYRELFPDATIHCFEPFPESFEQLERAAAGLAPIELHAVALAAAAGEARFSVNRNSATNSLLASDAHAEVYWRGDMPKTVGTLSVATRTLDDFVAEHSIPRIDVLKLDAQGGEYDILLGARDTLGRQAVALVYMELITAPTYVGQHRIREYLELFDDSGYELFDVYNLGRSQGRLLQTDIIVVSPKTLAQYEARLGLGSAGRWGQTPF
ncbi:MAG TPA: FkbM family methyltransferase [Gammaproteobacteria bacterium]|nr:FkbM family methyltransferase [Gammaproteobacteria bacterium]